MENFRCQDLCKAFDGTDALSEVTVEFPSSGITAIIGPNGAGKTTLFNTLTGFTRPSSGSCFLGTRETTRLPPYKISQLGVARTFQDLRLITQVSALDNVMLACPNQRGERLVAALLRFRVASEESQNREEAMKTLRFVGLEGHAHELVCEMSYGQQKLVTLAVCLATGAQILLLDEPVAGVDPKMSPRILDLLNQLRAMGKLIVFIEHDISAVRQLADHLVVMDRGTIIEQGPPGKVLEMPEIMEAYLA